ncbi:MAG: hypothetical protein K0U72_11435 [Gammaproteobacteria bacterium]|nr:hypothetical protein [Gammaproteobacteria bacterium]
MKTKLTIAGLLVCLAPTVAIADVSESQVWTKTFDVSTTSPRLSIDNVWGNVRVRAGTEGEITVTATETRSAPDQGLFDRSKVLLVLDTYADVNGVSMTVGDRENRWRNNDHCSGCRLEYQFDVAVPKGAIVDVATVMDGKIDVSGVYGRISASNVNGPIDVQGMQDCDSVESINGAVDLEFATAPGQNCKIDTINGDVTVYMPSGSGLDVALDIFNGKVVSEFATDTYAVPAQVEYEQSDGGRRYRIQQSAGLRLEGGGPTFSISSMNGDVRIQKN